MPNWALAMKCETGKLPRGQRYPLNASMLAAALAEAGIEIDVHLVRSPGSLYDAHFWPPSPNILYERLYIRVGSVLTERAADARRLMADLLLPRLVQWLGEILAADPKSPIRRERQHFDLSPD